MNKKSIIFKTAIRLFSAQGYEVTTTLQVAKEVGVTEPAVFYYFKNKNDLFYNVLEEAAKVYSDRIDAVELDVPTSFEPFAALIRIHFSVVVEESEFMRILLRTCPVRLEDPESTCTKVYREAKFKLKETVMEILEKGMTTGEFIQVDIDATSNMLIALF